MTKERSSKDDSKSKRLNLNTKIDCNTTVKLARLYFDGSISYSIKDCVLEHLLVCKECYAKYRKLAKESGTSFNLKKEAIQFVKDDKVKKCNRLTKAMLEKLGFLNDIKYSVNEWSIAANSFDVTRLMNLKAFSDFALEEFVVKLDSWDNDIDAINNFSRWFVKKIAKDIDFLERCYTLEITEITSNKNIKRKK